MIAQNNLKRVIEQLNTLFFDFIEKNNDNEVSEYYDQLILLSGKLKRIHRETDLGLIDSKFANLENSRLSHSVLNLINVLPNQLFFSHEIKEVVIEKPIEKKNIITKAFNDKDTEPLNEEKEKIDQEKSQKEQELLEKKALQEKQKAERAEKRKESRDKKKQAALEIKNKHLAFEAGLKKVLKKYAGQDDFHFEANIPKKKLENARSRCVITDDEEVIALIDATLFKSAKLCLLFARKGVYYKNDWASKQSGAHFINYTEFKNRQLKIDGTELSFDKDGFFDLSGSALDVETGLKIFKSIQRLALKHL